jgi:hypothetical protein
VDDVGKLNKEYRRLTRGGSGFPCCCFLAIYKVIRSLVSFDGDIDAFGSFMDIIQTALTRGDFKWTRFDGTMDMKKRGAAIAEFRSPSTSPKVMIISLKAGGVGLNVRHCVTFCVMVNSLYLAYYG